MTNNRLEVILQRNQQRALLDVLLAVVFVVAAMTTGLAMKNAFGQLAGVPVSSGVPASTLLTSGAAPCAEPGTTRPLPVVFI